MPHEHLRGGCSPLAPPPDFLAKVKIRCGR